VTTFKTLPLFKTCLTNIYNWRLLIFLSFVVADVTSAKVCCVPFTDISPKIDGVIESLWSKGDSIVDFIQYVPIEGTAATEKTTVYLLQSNENIYVAFKCFDADPLKLNARLVSRDCFSDNGDNVWIMLDTFGDKTTAYEFGVNATGVQTDDRLSWEGRIWDPSYDGVWYSAAKITDYGYNVEMKIPFKTIRFKAGFSEWGGNFFRFISHKNEYDCWFPQHQSEGTRVSRCGILKGLNPGKQGLHLELYPVGITRYDSNSINPQVGLDFNWCFPSSQLSFTTYPDFAQIEADPYTLNLSKYETYFEEKRPFFIESQEIFNTPIKLFYSRRIGKKLDTGEEVPIIGGAKYTATLGRLNLGFLSAYTDSILNEPKSLYSVGRVKLGVLKNSEVGAFYTETRSNYTQTVAGVDATFRTTELQVQSQFAHSDSGNAGITGFSWYARNFTAEGKYEKYDKEFSIEQLGFAPWKGVTKYSLNIGPQWFNKSIFRRLTTGVQAGNRKEIGEPESGHWIGAWNSFDFNNNCGFSISFITGKDYETNTLYDYYTPTLSIWTDHSKPIVISCDGLYNSCEYNYRRDYFAPISQNNFSVEYKVSPPLSITLDASNTLEWKPNRGIEAVSWVLRPIIQYAITKDIHLRIYTEPNTDTHIHQFNALLSYNFRPKSWLYLAFNQAVDYTKDKMDMTNRIAVMKVRYLFFW